MFKSKMLAIYASRGLGILGWSAIALRNVLVVTISVLTVAGCQNSNISREPKQATGPLLSIDPTTVGSITGTVSLEGNVPGAGVVDTPCGKENSLPGAPAASVNEHTGELANAVIYLKVGLANYRYVMPKDPVILDQKGCIYDPHVIALMTNQPLQIKNSDPIAHNVHVLAKVNKQWDHSEPPGVAPIIESFPTPELAVHVICKIHIGMSAFLFVFDNPFYAVTSSTGGFELKNVPPGTYTVEAWREHFGTQDQTVTLGPNESKTISFVFKAGSS